MGRLTALRRIGTAEHGVDRDHLIEALLALVVRLTDIAETDEPLPQNLLPVEGQQGGDIGHLRDAGEKASRSRVGRISGSGVVVEEHRTPDLVSPRPNAAVVAVTPRQERGGQQQRSADTNTIHDRPPRFRVFLAQKAQTCLTRKMLYSLLFPKAPSPRTKD